MSNQLHRRLTKDQVIVILENYLAKEITAKEAKEKLELKKSQFFNLVARYKNNSSDFSVEYRRKKSNNKISEEAEEKILAELKADKELIENKDVPIRVYNYTTIKETLEEKYKIKTSLSTIISRAKENNFYVNKPKTKIHDREVLTNFVGELEQHDSSHHLWSPYMDRKLYLITTIDDYSRMLLYAELVEQENVWQHILALKSVFLRYGCPLKYYPDQHAIFRYVKDRDKNRPHNTFSKFTDDVDPQWKQVLNTCNVGLTYALSPQAKGKIERPYRWIQERIVRTAAKEKLTTIDELKNVLKELITKYNTKWVHSTTKEIPIVRFENAIRDNKTLFKPFSLTISNQTVDDVFCLKASRVVDSYRKISFEGLELRVPNGTPRQTVDLKITPDEENGLAKIRYWENDNFLGEHLEKLEKLPTLRF